MLHKPAIRSACITTHVDREGVQRWKMRYGSAYLKSIKASRCQDSRMHSVLRCYPLSREAMFHLSHGTSRVLLPALRSLPAILLCIVGGRMCIDTMHATSARTVVSLPCHPFRTDGTDPILHPGATRRVPWLEPSMNAGSMSSKRSFGVAARAASA